MQLGWDTSVRAIGLSVPMALTGFAWLLRRPNRRLATGALLAAAWTFPTLLTVNLIAASLGWWRFQPAGGQLMGVPVDLLLGWSFLWGTLPALVFRKLGMGWLAALVLTVDLVFMPLANPVLQLGGHWLVGEIVVIAISFVPAQLLARWTGRDIRVAWRAAMQAICFAGLVVGVLPAIILTMTHADWPPPLFLRPGWVNGLMLQLLAVPAIIGLSAAQEFAIRGHGTPLPYDPPVRLVTTGLYRYMSSPMQVSGPLTLLCCGILLGSKWVALASVVGLAYNAGLAGWSEGREMADRFPGIWQAYSLHVRKWIPGWRPSGETPAVIYVAQGCDICRGVGGWIARREPIALAIAAAETHPARRLDRITYECEGYEDEGVAAFARALEHINFAWAFVGCVIRLPVIGPIIQVIIDAVGAGPREIEHLENVEEPRTW